MATNPAPDPRDKRLAARYMAGTSLDEVARLAGCSAKALRARIIAAGAVIRKHGERG